MFFLRNLVILCVSLPSLSHAVSDPLDSPSWSLMHERVLNNGPVIFDQHVQVNAPAYAEDPLNVPVSVMVSGLESVEEVVVFADLNPIQQILSIRQHSDDISFSFRFKVEQATPLRAAARTADGQWHVGGLWLEAAGGGCTVSSQGMAEGTWPQTLMNVSWKYWEREQYDRLRFRVMHPMDTGLAPGIPEFYLQHLTLKDQQGSVLAEVDLYQPVNENPVITLDLDSSAARPLILEGRDNNGNRLQQELAR